MKSYTELTKIGVSPQETRLYLSMLALGDTTVSEIARSAAIHRPMVYKMLPRLCEKGLVFKQASGKRERYRAEHPSRLKYLMQHVADDIEALIPELEATYRPAEIKPLVRYLEGARGIASVYDDILTTLAHGATYYRVSSAKPEVYDSGRFLPSRYLERRNHKQLERFVITTEQTKAKQKPDLNRAVKTIPAKYGLFDFNVTEIIYGGKIAFIDYKSETAVIIENERIAEFQKKVFKMTYDNLPTN